jgi:hypothetical protein
MSLTIAQMVARLDERDRRQAEQDAIDAARPDPGEYWLDDWEPDETE